MEYLILGALFIAAVIFSVFVSEAADREMSKAEPAWWYRALRATWGAIVEAMRLILPKRLR